jgi:flagellar biosynthetic protein FlhB
MKGQVARSMDLNGAVVLLAGLVMLSIIGPKVVGRMKDVVSSGLARTGQPELAERDGVGDLAGWVGSGIAGSIVPLLVVVGLAAIIVNVAQVRLKLTPKAAAPKLSLLNPLPGVKRVFGPNGLFEGGKATVKIAIVSVVAFMAVGPAVPELAALVGLPVTELLPRIGSLTLGIAFRIAIAYLVVAIADYLWQRRRHERSLKMSKDEIRREARQHDVAPEVRGAIRRRQREQARKRMLAAVPTADVVVTNPTHFAVALRYDGTVPAPEVIAKGADLVAAAIRRAAEEAGVPILRNPSLARALYHEVELGRMVPEKLYAAVAEVLAFVYRTAGRKARPKPGRKRATPRLRLGA